MSTPRMTVKSGIMMIPPPKPDNEPIKPAKIAPRIIIRVNVSTVIRINFVGANLRIDICSGGI